MNSVPPLSHPPALSAQKPSALWIIPWSERPILPTQTLPLTCTHKATLQALRKWQSSSATPLQTGFGLLCVDNNETWTPEAAHPGIGCYVRILHMTKQPRKIQCVVEGICRFEITHWEKTSPPFLAHVSYPDATAQADPTAIRAYAIAIINLLKELTPLNPIYSEEIKFFLNRFVMTDPSSLTDFAAALTTADKTAVCEILHCIPMETRMQKVIDLIRKEVEIIQLQAKIRTAVENRLGEQQRRLLLQEQLKAIQKELGISKDDRTADRERFEERLESLEVPEHAMKRIEEELEKLSILELGSPEYTVTRNYLDVITALPWNVFSQEKYDLKRAKRLLNAEHEGLEDVKARILECLAIGQLKGEISGAIILLVGPPGVGKTSIGRCIARALNRKFYRFSVGGMRDEAEIKGHRRTYIGAMPGKIIHALLETETANPVIMLDEIDKMGASYQGDPASALLEVLDPAQQHDFLDHYLDVRFDLSRVLFVCTANQTDTMPQALLDRMEILQVSGYVAEEKMRIACKHLWPKVLQKTGLDGAQLKMHKKTMRHIIEQYARESGVRNLEKQLARIARKCAVKWVTGRQKSTKIEVEDIRELLGPPVFLREQRITGIGVATGLAWTALGGEILSIEANTIPSTQPKLKLTGTLGEVMKESAEIAYSYVLAHAEEYGIDPTFFTHSWVHLHVPEGATPKDGPSAGITMASALLSLALGKKIPPHVAMSGELTLTGQVLPVGGIREKLIAAKRGNRHDVILPAACKGDCLALPAYVHTQLKLHFVQHYQEIFALLFRAR